MRATSRAIVTCVALTLTLVAASTWADDKPAQKPEDLVKAMAEAGKPGPEHAKLKPLVGSWTYTCKFWMDPNQPPMESKGTIERKLVLGGRFLEEKVTGTNFDGTPGFEGVGLIGYDNGQQKYTSTWHCNMGTGTHTGLGSADASGTKFTLQTEAFCPLQKKTIKGREEIRIESEDKIVAESYVTENGKEMKLMELVSIRKK
jgi:Protein of unknown function (DUF1579)